MRNALSTLFTLGLLLFAAPLFAQNPVNPSAITFDHVDFAATADYSVGYFADAVAVTPVQFATLPKPATCAPCSGPLVSRPNTFQTWYVGVRANGTLAGPPFSAWSVRVPFDRSPLAPTGVTLK